MQDILLSGLLFLQLFCLRGINKLSDGVKAPK